MHECSIAPGEWIEWPNEPLYSLLAEYERLKRLGKRNLPTWDEFLAHAREHQADPIEVSSDHRQALIAGADPRPIWIEYTVSVIGAICREREFLSAINVWSHCALPTGFGGVGLMAKAFDRAVERCSVPQLSTSTARRRPTRETPRPPSTHLTARPSNCRASFPSIAPSS